MALTDIEQVRLKTGDRPILQREAWTADGLTSDIRVAAKPILDSPVPRVWKENVLLVDVTDYTIDQTNGIVTLTSVPTVGARVVIEYAAVVFSDEEVQALLDASGSNTFLAAAHLLWAWAADASRLAQKETRSGGSGFGLVTLDTSVRARELRLSAKALYDLWAISDAGINAPADGLTEIPWTDQQANRYINTRLDRDLFDLNNG